MNEDYECTNGNQICMRSDSEGNESVVIENNK